MCFATNGGGRRGAAPPVGSILATNWFNEKKSPNIILWSSVAFLTFFGLLHSMYCMHSPCLLNMYRLYGVNPGRRGGVGVSAAVKLLRSRLKDEGCRRCTPGYECLVDTSIGKRSAPILKK